MDQLYHEDIENKSSFMKCIAVLYKFVEVSYTIVEELISGQQFGFMLYDFNNYSKL